jgi:2-polyprenyl-6-methoxyphenol hydroxylase-like FAD-dependent oxidoreductase
VRILCVGGGPAGLYFALLHKRARPLDHVAVVEQNRADATYGWGVVLSDKALAFLQGGDARFMDDLLGRLESSKEASTWRTRIASAGARPRSLSNATSAPGTEPVSGR